MKEEEIKKWEEKAKTGLLYGDDLLKDLLKVASSSVFASIVTLSVVTPLIVNLSPFISTSLEDLSTVIPSTLNIAFCPCT